MISILPNKKQTVMLRGLQIDTTLSEDHSYSNNITNYPVEKGADICDHVKSQPERLTIECITSNTPVKFISENVRDFIIQDNSNRAKLAFDTLLSYAGYVPSKQVGVDAKKIAEAKILTIVTRYKVYNNMIISSISFPRNASTGDALNYTIEFKKISILEVSSTTTVKTASSLNGKAPNVENQAPETSDQGKNTGSTKKVSVIKRVINFIFKKRA